MPADSDIRIGWCTDPSVADRAAALFVEQASANYISHAELQEGLAETPSRWAADLDSRVRAQLGHACSPSGHTRLLTATDAAELLGYAVVEARAGESYAILHDFFVARAGRGRGIGSALLDWIAQDCRAHGFRRLFLESGITNHSAHEFFESRGFATTSIVMMRDL